MIGAPITDIGLGMSNMSMSGSYSKNQAKDASSFGDIISNVTATQNINVNDPAEVTAAYNDRSQVMADDAMNMSSNTETYRESNKVSDASDKKDTSSKVQDSSNDNNNKVSENNQVKADKTDKVSDKGIDEDSKAEIENEVLNKVSDELDISVEELEDVLANLGLTALDLINPQNVSALVAEIKADGDMMALVTDESLSNLVGVINTDIQETLDTVSADLGITVSDLMSKIDETIKNNVSVTNEFSSINESDEAISNIDRIVVSGDIETEEAVNNVANYSNKVDNEVNNEANKEADKEADNEVVNEASGQADVESEKADNNSSNAEANHNSFAKDNKENNIVDNTISVYAESTANNEVTFENVLNTENVNYSSQATNAQEIISQITEHLKTQMKDGITELQMQLNPENLGTVHLTLASKETGVTAQLTAQNEAVKAALENQIMVLKENLENQGVKVEAVEVTVASHEFERNLDQNSENQNNQSQEEEAERLRKATRKIDVSGYFTDEDIAALDEAEQVTAKMMKADGNSMDYKA